MGTSLQPQYCLEVVNAVRIGKARVPFQGIQILRLSWSGERFKDQSISNNDSMTSFILITSAHNIIYELHTLVHVSYTSTIHMYHTHVHVSYTCTCTIHLYMYHTCGIGNSHTTV